MNRKAISILGCGWLGLPLAQHLVSLGFNVKGSTTTLSKLKILEEAGIEPFLIEARPQLKGDNIRSFFESDTLFLDIPFKRHLADPTVYQSQVEAVLDHVRLSPVSFVIFTSSTSVYPDHLGQVSEETVFVPDNPRSQVLRKIEQMLLEQKKFQATVIRFGGLYGASRHLGQFLSREKGKTIDNGNSPVNLIHLDDGIDIITRIIVSDVRGEIFNAVSDHHPPRKELYSKAAAALGLPAPAFSRSGGSRRKVVDNTKLKQRLNFCFKYPDPLEALEKS